MYEVMPRMLRFVFFVIGMGTGAMGTQCIASDRYVGRRDIGRVIGGNIR